VALLRVHTTCAESAIGNCSLVASTGTRAVVFLAAKLVGVLDHPFGGISTAMATILHFTRAELRGKLRPLLPIIHCHSHVVTSATVCSASGRCAVAPTRGIVGLRRWVTIQDPDHNLPQPRRQELIEAPSFPLVSVCKCKTNVPSSKCRPSSRAVAHAYGNHRGSERLSTQSGNVVCEGGS
jgi:hypothetical protein